MLPFGGDLLAIYLQDHLAGATAGVELARRARAQNREGELGRFLAALCKEIEQDRESLQSIMSGLGVGRDRLKLAAAWSGEKAGRLKLNGRLVGYSPLSRVIEVEGLMIGVRGKLALWGALRVLADGDERLDAVELDRLAARARSQLDQLDEHHRTAVRALGEDRAAQS